jgi:beta-lactamase class A
LCSERGLAYYEPIHQESWVRPGGPFARYLGSRKGVLLKTTLRGALALFPILLIAASFTEASPQSTERLRVVVEEAIEGSSGEMGVAIKHVESGEELVVNGKRPYPMASTYKVAILVEFFNQVDEGKIGLDEMVSLGPMDLHRGSGQLKRFIVPGVSLSMENLAYLMMRVSDNTATDMVLARVGFENVNRRLESLGVTGMSVNRSTQRLILDYMGFDDWDTQGMTYEELEEKLNEYQVEPGELEMAATRFELDPQDTATPVAMNALLEKIFLGQAASPESCRKMLDIMLRCETGRNRLRGLLPESVEVAHKTGTIGGTVDDVGILYLPEGRGHVIISVLSKSCQDREKAEQAIADIARYAYDYFLFTAPESAEASRETGSVLSVP